MISNASDRSLSSNPGTLPNVSEALFSYFQRLTFTAIVKTIVNFQVLETKIGTSFMGVRQPFTPQQLSLKPEGQRAWKWETIHATPELILSPDDVISFDGNPYRVMRKSDFKEYGYVLYEICQDYTP